MLTQHTAHLLAQLLHCTVEAERTVERSRHELCTDPRFDPYAAFSTLDRLSIRGVSTTDLKEFLNRAGVYSPSDCLALVVSQYDNDGDGRRSLPDFFQLALPSEDLGLREATEGRRIGPVLPFAVQWSLARHIQLEAEQQSDLEQIKRSVMSMPDFNHQNAFRTIDREGFNHITTHQLRSYLKQHGYLGLESDGHALLRRIDTDGDSKISFIDFLEFLSSLPVSTHQAAPLESVGTSSPPRHTSPLKPSSPLRQASPPRQTSPQRKSSPLRPSRSLRPSSLWTPASPLGKTADSPYNLQNLHRTGDAGSSCDPGSPQRVTSPLKNAGSFASGAYRGTLNTTEPVRTSLFRQSVSSV